MKWKRGVAIRLTISTFCVSQPFVVVVGVGYSQAAHRRMGRVLNSRTRSIGAIADEASLYASTDHLKRTPPW